MKYRVLALACLVLALLAAPALPDRIDVTPLKDSVAAVVLDTSPADVQAQSTVAILDQYGGYIARNVPADMTVYNQCNALGVSAVTYVATPNEEVEGEYRSWLCAQWKTIQSCGNEGVVCIQ